MQTDRCEVCQIERVTEKSEIGKGPGNMGLGGKGGLLDKYIPYDVHLRELHMNPLLLGMPAIPVTIAA